MVLPQMDVRGAFELQSDVDALYAQVATMDAKFQAWADLCSQHPTGQYMPYVSTTAAVRDMVSLANYLEGNDTLINYWGVCLFV